MENVYIPFRSKILDIKQHTDIDYTFRMEFTGDVKPGQFFEVSIPKFGEAPISVCEIGENYVDLTIRKVGKVTDVIHTFFIGQYLFMRGPYGNGFDINIFKGKEVVVAAGGTGLAPVKGIIDFFYNNPKECIRCSALMGFKSEQDILFKENIEMWKENIDVIYTVDNGQEGYIGNVGLITGFVKDITIDNMDEVQVVIVGPPIMFKFTAMEFIKRGVKEKNIWVSFERKMCCGVGKCGHCKMDDTYICLDGPVFNYAKSKHLID